jgi:hypothetical protein
MHHITARSVMMAGLRRDDRATVCATDCNE